MRRRIELVTRLLLPVLVAVGLALPTAARASWWNDDWSVRNPIVIDTSAAGAPINDPIGTTPVLIRLHVGNFKFDIAKDDGSDIRFVADDDKTPLKYHIEKYDGLLQEAFIWVGVPNLKPGAQTNLWIYYGNKKANPAEDAKGTFDPDTVLVYHFGDHAAPPRDFTSWANTAQGAGVPVDNSFIGPGVKFDGNNAITLPASPSLTWAAGATMTWSAWVQMAAPQPNTTLFSRHNGSGQFRIGLDNGIPFAEVGGQRSTPGAAIKPASWHHLAVVAGQQITLFLDGESYATLNATLPALADAAILGHDPAVQGAGFAGELDELEISKVARPAGFIKAAAIGQGGETAAKFLKLGEAEENASWGSGYLTVILRSVTLDGWVVIGLLMVMAAFSWVVMVTKTRYVRTVAKGNHLFLRKFHEISGDLSMLERGSKAEIGSMGGRVKGKERRLIEKSSLFHLYHIGAEEIVHRFGGVEVGSKVLAAQSIAAIRARLDSGMVRQNQKLNSLMVVLTIAISGGPFLGLLGTVVGVMITFAAIAASGDVNVNAIAPGIAAALVATVAGLTVAIPALFGYNYLVSQIKDASSDMQVFVDEFVTKLAEFYRGHSERRPAAAE
jgi:biopolymer transport protein ExbB